jgi:hypothetical protein
MHLPQTEGVPDDPFEATQIVTTSNKEEPIPLPHIAVSPTNRTKAEILVLNHNDDECASQNQGESESSPSIMNASGRYGMSSTHGNTLGSTTSSRSVASLRGKALDRPTSRGAKSKQTIVFLAEKRLGDKHGPAISPISSSLKNSPYLAGLRGFILILLSTWFLADDSLLPPFPLSYLYALSPP